MAKKNRKNPFILALITLAQSGCLAHPCPNTKKDCEDCQYNVLEEAMKETGIPVKKG